MGKATIVSGGADGLYSVRLDYGKATQTARLTAIAARLAELVGLLAAALDDLNLQEYAQAALVADVEGAIAAFVAAAQALPVAQQAVTVASDNNQVVAASTTATTEEKAAAAEALVVANAALKAAEEAYQTTLKAHTEALKKLAESNRKTAPLKLAFDLLKAEQTQLKKDQAKWAALVLEETLPAWCADLTEDATGDVATVEIPGESKLVLIAPAAPAHVPARDGALAAREVQTPAQVFFNAAILPGWQKYKPTFRRGTITAINHEADLASVTLEPGDVSSAQALGINQATTLAGVPVVYMGCNAAAFEVGDQCVVQFTGQDWAQPKVVGFVDHPKGCASYEFWTTEHVVSNTKFSPGFEASPGYQIGSAVSMAKSGRAVPLYSTALTPPEPGPGAAPKWPLRAFDYEPTGPSADTFKTWGSWQSVRCFEYALWPAYGNTSVVISCQAQAPGWNSQLNWKSARASSRVANAAIYTADILLDVRPMLYVKDGYRAAAPGFADPWVWFRRATVQTAGGRQFFIHTDNVGRFQVYAAPAANSRNPYDHLTPSQYKTFTPPYPAWVTVPDPANYENQQRHWLWTFNSTGTRAVACPFHSTRGEFYKSLEPQYQFATVLPEDLAALNVPAGSMVPSFEDVPGLVEFGIEITSTGTGEMDFEVAFTLLRSDYFAESGRFIFDAAYAMPYKGNGTHKDAYPAVDTLLTAELQCFTPAAGDYQAGPMPAHDVPHNYFVDRVDNAQAKWVFNANDASLAPTELLRLHAMGPSRFQFLTPDGYRARTGPTTWAGGPVNGYYPTIGSNVPLAAGGFKFYRANSAVENDEPLPAARPLSLGELYCLELRTLSLTYIEADQANQTQATSLRHYSEVIDSGFATYAGAPSTPVPMPEATVPVPPSGLAVYMHMFTTALNTDWGQGFTVHPAGHWSHGVTGAFNESSGVGSFDIVQPYKGRRTSHKALFNQAFEQNRDYSFYKEPYAGKVLWDNGSFRSAGVWITF